MWPQEIQVRNAAAKARHQAGHRPPIVAQRSVSHFSRQVSCTPVAFSVAVELVLCSRCCLAAQQVEHLRQREDAEADDGDLEAHQGTK